MSDGSETALDQLDVWFALRIVGAGGFAILAAHLYGISPPLLTGLVMMPVYYLMERVLLGKKLKRSAHV